MGVNNFANEQENSEAAQAKLEGYLKKIYYDPTHEAGFSGINRLYNFVKQDKEFDVPISTIEEWLQKQEVYTTHFRKKKPKHHSPVVVPGLRYQFDIDTAVLPSIGKKGLKYFVLAIDIFSRKVAAQAIKNMKGKEVKRAMQEIFNDLGFPKKVRTDQGTEYLNREVQNMLEGLEVGHFVAYPPNKANYAERAIRSIKNLLFKHMQSSNKKQWNNEMLQSIVKGYNKKFHSGVGMAPIKVNKRNEPEIWFSQQQKHLSATPHPSPFKFQINDAVRVKLFDNTFKKDYEIKFSQQIYFISSRSSPYDVNRYMLKTFSNIPVKGSYSESELQKVIINKDTTFRVEKVLSRKTEGGVKLLKVRWEGYDAQYDSWIEASELESHSS